MVEEILGININFPFISLGTINSRHFFGIDELLIYDFYKRREKKVLAFSYPAKHFIPKCLKQSIDKSFNNCNVIFDPNFLTFKEIIENVNFLNNQKNIKFYFLSTDFLYLIEASKMNKKGKIVFL